MRSPKSLAILLIITLLVVAIAPAGVLAHDTGGDEDVASAGPELWQIVEAPEFISTPGMGSTWKSMRMPAREVVENWLLQQGKIDIDTGDEGLRVLVDDWYNGFIKRNYLGPNPLEKRQLMVREQALLEGIHAPDEDPLPTLQRNPLFVVVEFGGTDTMTIPRPDPGNPGGACVDRELSWGPTHLGELPAPGSKDNNTFWLDNPTVADYEAVVYGVGPDAPGYGVIEHPNLGPVDLTGLTANNFLLEMSHGTSQIGGSFLQDTLLVDRSHEYYGHQAYATIDDVCELYRYDAQSWQLPLDAVDVIQDTYNDTLDCSQWDTDGDHVIDNFVVVHAGDGNERGCDDCIWSHSSFYPPPANPLPPFFPNPARVCGFSTPFNPFDDYYVRDFNLVLEPLALSVIIEEYEHLWGLPDLYTVDSSNSNSYWGAPHNIGSLAGELGGTRPVGHNLWQDFMLGWRNPLIVDYDDPALELVLGRNRDKPENTEDGLIIRLPDQLNAVDNSAGEGTGWYSDAASATANGVTRDFDLTDATGQTVFSFDADWHIEEDWDYGYLQVSTDDGATWTTLADMDGYLTDSNPNNNNLGWGLTGQGDGNLRFDLSAFSGSVISLKLLYLTDLTSALTGLKVDNLLLIDGGGTLYENDLEEDFSDWTNSGWRVVPLVDAIEHYYLVEWWDDNGMFNSALNTAHQTYWFDYPAQEWTVSRLPFNTPGMVVSYRNTGEEFDYELASNLADSPSIGPKYGLLVVDSHYGAMRFDTHFPNFQNGWAGLTVTGRTKTGNGSFSLHDTPEKSAYLGLDYLNGQYVDPPLEYKTWESQPGVPAFHDSISYYPGFYYPEIGPHIYLHDWDSSAALPAAGDYTTQITTLDGMPLESLYGIPIGPVGLGTGNPGDLGVQYGVHVKILEESDQQATIRVWNSMVEFDGAITQTPSTNPVVQGSFIDVDVTATNIGSPIDAFMVVPIDPDTEYVMGSAYGGATPLTSAAAMQMGMERGLQSLIDLAGDGDPDEVVAVAFMGDVGTGETVDFGFTVQVVSETGSVQHSVAIFDGATFMQEFTSDEIEIVDNGDYTINRSKRFDIVRDTFIDGDRPTTWFGTSVTMWVGFYDEMRPIMHAPISGIPGDAAIDVGYLYTYITEGRGFYMWPGSVINASVHALSTEWLPYPANWVMPWSAPGGDFGPVVDTNHIGSGKIGTWLRLDITEIAEDIVRGAPNYGFILTSDDDHGVRYGLATQDYWDPSKVGYVRVMYRTAN